MGLNQSVIVTGASGFVGRALCRRLMSGGLHLKGTILINEDPESIIAGVEAVPVEPLGGETRYEQALDKIDTVIHLAARVHVMHETASDPFYEFHKTNTLGTANLARQAAATGVKRFVYMSTIGVNGDDSGDKPYSESDRPHPHNPYSVSKYEAELVLKQISSETGMEVVVIRAPLVYGPGNPGNFLSLLRIVSKGMPLPLGSVNNERSLIYVGNLVDAIAICAIHPAAAGQTYLVSDGEDVSTPELIRRTAKALGIHARLFSFPPLLIMMIGKLTGRTSSVSRLLGSLTVDSSKIKRELGWEPLSTMTEGLRETAEWFNKKYANV